MLVVLPTMGTLVGNNEWLQWLVGWALSLLTWEWVLTVQLPWILGWMRRKVVPVCPEAEQPILAEVV